MFGIKGQEVTSLGAVKLGDEKTGVSHVAITLDGESAIVTRDGDSLISVLSIDGTVERLPVAPAYCSLEVGFRLSWWSYRFHR